MTCFADRTPEPPPSNCAETIYSMPKDEHLWHYQLAPTTEPWQREVPELYIDCIFSSDPYTNERVRSNQCDKATQRNCVVTVDLMQDTSALVRTMAIWYAAKAIDAMCVTRGRGGGICI